MRAPPRVLFQIVGHVLGEQNVTRITAIHHPLRDVDPGSGDIGLLVQITDFIDRAAVNAHPHPQFGMMFEFSANLDRAQDRRFEDYTLVLAAAEAGLGVALARVPLADAYLQKSGLVRVSRHEVASPLTYYFVHAKGESRPEVLALIDRMQAAQQGVS